MPDPAADEAPAPTAAAVFATFLQLGLLGFGGVLPLTRIMLVERRRWLTGPEFTELLALCQFLPGGNICNLSFAVGFQFRGVLGGLAGLTGLVSGPTVVVIVLGTLYDRFKDDPHFQRLFAGLAAAAAGLLIATALKMLAPLRTSWRPLSVACLCIVAIALFRAPLLWTMLVLVPVSLLVAWQASWAQRR